MGNESSASKLCSQAHEPSLGSENNKDQTSEKKMLPPRRRSHSPSIDRNESAIRLASSEISVKLIDRKVQTARLLSPPGP